MLPGLTGIGGFMSGGGGGVVLPTVTWNPSDKDSSITLSGSDLTATKGGTAALKSVRATRGIADTDNGYFEIVVVQDGFNAPFMLVGVATASLSLGSYVGSDTNSWGYYQDTGQKYTNSTGASYGAGWGTGGAGNGVVIGVAFKNGKLWFAKNGTWQNSGDPAAGTGEAFSGITGTLYPTMSLYRHDFPNQHSVTGRFRTSAFAYAPPSGFSPWGG